MDPDFDEFELMYADELDAMDEMDGFHDNDRAAKKSKKSLDFTNGNKSSTTSHALQGMLQSFDTDLMDLDEMLSTQPPLPAAPNSPQIRAVSPPLLEAQPPTSPTLEEVQHALNFSDTRKRKSDQLFGDIDDIGSDDDLFDMRGIGTYKKRNTEDDKNTKCTDEMLIKMIKAERQKHVEDFNVQSFANGVSKNLNCDPLQFYSTRVPNYPFMSVRNFNYDKYYLRLRSVDYIENEAAKITSKSCGLLPGSYKTVWDEAKAMLKQRREMVELMRKCDALDGGESTGGEFLNKDLWVHKYRPRTYRDLLSDEGTNKTLLKWLKFWDQVVFNIKRKPKPVQVLTPMAEKKQGKYHNSKFTKNPQKVLNEEFDSYGRPAQKIALLCGPPGLGKTTLAHIVAKHAGYNPVEVNASDDSSPEAFRLQLEAATQMKSVLGNESRPNCLILDEIDGSQAGAIDVLVRFISDKGVTKGKKKQGAKPHILKRPIICICNDLYVPALRPLKQVALIINFPPTASAKLAQRLMEVAIKEKLKTDFGALLLLCDKTGNDIRSCLSFLHFFQSRGRKVQLLDVQNASVGQKDTQKGLFDVWQNIFQIVKHKGVGNDKQAGKGAGGGGTSVASRMIRILKIVQSFGDYERLTQGVFENYLRMKMKDTRFGSISNGTEWFCYFDQLNTTLKENQSYVLMPYMPYCFVLWHFQFAGMAWPVLTYPNTNYEVTVKTSHNLMTLNAVLRGMNPHTRSGTKAAEMVLDTLPLMLYIAIPSLKNVNTQLFNLTEKSELMRVVNIFIEFGIVYVQERTSEGDMIYRMEPNVPELVQFPDVPHAHSTTYGIKQLISYEVESEKIRRVNGVWGSQCALTGASPSPKPKPKLKNSSPAPAVLPNHLQTLSPQIRKTQIKPGLKNWLSITRNTNVVAKEEAAAIAAENSLNEIAFIYKEGYSNAVRKTIRILDLL